MSTVQVTNLDGGAATVKLNVDPVGVQGLKGDKGDPGDITAANLGTTDFAISGLTGGFERDLNERFKNLPTVSIKDFGADFGAIGDGATRKLSAATVSAKTSTFGFSGDHRLNDFDDEDTEDWLAAALALKHLESKGGGTLYLPRPDVFYPFRRFLPIPMGVPIRIMGDGRHPTLNDIENVCDLTGGWNDFERRSVFQVALFKLNALVDGGAGASTQVNMAATFVAYSSILPLVAGGGSSFSVNDRVVVYHRDNYSVGATVCPHRLVFRKVIDISGDDLLLDEAIPFPLPSNKGRVAKMGTGSDGSFGNAPYDYPEDLVIQGLAFAGSHPLGSGSAGRRVLLADFRATTDRGATVAQNAGLGINGFQDSRVRDFEIITVNRGLEVKGGSGGRWYYDPDEDSGGTGLLIENGLIRKPGSDSVSVPLGAVGESSNCKLRNITFQQGAGGFSSMLNLSDSEIIVGRGLTFEANGGSSSSVQPIKWGGHPAPIDRSLADIRGVRMGGADGEFVRICAISDPGDGRPRPNLILGKVRVGTTLGAFASGSLIMPYLGHGSIFDIESEVGETIGYHGTSVIGSPVPEVLGATAAQLADETHWINTNYRKQGRWVYDTTNKRLLWSDGSKWTDSAQEQVFRVTTDFNIVDATLADIPGLAIPLRPNEVRSFEGIIFYDTTTANDININPSLPAGATMSMSNVGITTPAAAPSGAFNAVVLTTGSANYGGARASGAARVPVGLHVRGIVVNGATAGSLQLRARKLANTDTGSPDDDLLIYANSFIQ